jgi:hypothetical protein
MHAIRTWTCALALLLVSASVARSVEPPESLEAAINGGLQNHPEMVAAQAKITAARAEFDKVRLQIVGQIVAEWGHMKIKREEVNQLKQKIAVEKNNERLHELEGALVLAQGEYEQLTTQLHYMTQFTGGQGHGNSDQAPVVDLQVPHSRVARAALEKLMTPGVKLENLTDVPFKDLLDIVRTQTGVKIAIDLTGGIDPSMPVTINQADVTLFAALQAIEDCTGLQFVMRNYGVLATLPHVATDKGYVPVAKYATDHLGIDLTSLEEEQAAKQGAK